VTLTQALTIYHVHHTEQEPVRDTDLVNLATAFPMMEPVLMELQYRRNVVEQLERENDDLRYEVSDLREQSREWSE
jgi:hypothetical protein